LRREGKGAVYESKKDPIKNHGADAQAESSGWESVEGGLLSLFRVNRGLVYWCFN